VDTATGEAPSAVAEAGKGEGAAERVGLSLGLSLHAAVEHMLDAAVSVRHSTLIGQASRTHPEVYKPCLRHHECRVRNRLAEAAAIAVGLMDSHAQDLDQWGLPIAALQ